MTKDLIPKEVKYLSLDKQEVTLSFDIIKSLLVHGKPDLVSFEEAAFFIEMCKAKGLNPFKKDCYLIKYNQDPAAIIVSIDYYRARAYAQENCAGWQVGVIVQTKEGKVKYTNGLVLENETLLGAWFEAKPKNWEVTRKHEVNLKGYLQYTKDGRLTKFWQKDKQPTQIMKVVEAQGLRGVWPTEFEKLYIREEIYEGNGSSEHIEPEKTTISMEDFKAPEALPEELQKEPEAEPQKSKVSLEELRDRIRKACLLLAGNDPDAAKLTYHGFADIVNPITREDENGDKYTEFERTAAKGTNEISLEQARVIWGKIKKHCGEIGRDIKKELGID